MTTRAFFEKKKRSAIQKTLCYSLLTYLRVDAIENGQFPDEHKRAMAAVMRERERERERLNPDTHECAMAAVMSHTERQTDTHTEREREREGTDIDVCSALIWRALMHTCTCT